MNRRSTHPKANSDVVAREPYAHDVALDGVNVIQTFLARASNDGEGMLPLYRNVRMSRDPRARNTYPMQVERVRGADEDSWNGKLNRCVPGETVYASFGKEVLCELHAAQDLQKDRDRRGTETEAIDGEVEGTSSVLQVLEVR